VSGESDTRGPSLPASRLRTGAGASLRRVETLSSHAVVCAVHAGALASRPYGSVVRGLRKAHRGLAYEADQASRRPASRAAPTRQTTTTTRPHRAIPGRITPAPLTPPPPYEAIAAAPTPNLTAIRASTYAKGDSSAWCVASTGASTCAIVGLCHVPGRSQGTTPTRSAPGGSGGTVVHRRNLPAPSTTRRSRARPGAVGRQGARRDQRKACRLPQCATLRPILAASSSANRKWMPDQMRASTMSSTSCEKLVNWRVTPPGVVPLNLARSRR
jgi:hypothetical protein